MSVVVSIRPATSGDVDALGLIIVSASFDTFLGRIPERDINFGWTPDLSAASLDTILIGCVKENPSCGFYNHLGGVEVFRRPQQVDDYETEEIFFGWKTLGELR